MITVVDAAENARLFVLSTDGHAAELRLSDKEEARALRAKLEESERTGRALASELQAKLAESETSARQLAHELQAMRRSTSWRATWPIRQIGRAARRIFGR